MIDKELIKQNITQTIYDHHPSQFEDRVDGVCNMSWVEASQLRTKEVIAAAELAERIVIRLTPVLEKTDAKLFHQSHKESMGH